MNKAQVAPRGVNQGALINLLKALRSRGFTVAGLAVGSTTTAVKTANTLQFAINGVNYSKAAEDDITVSGMTNTGVGQFCKIRIEVNSAGTIGFVQGGFAGNQAEARIPTRSASKATVGYVEIPASFTFGTSNFNDAGVSFVNGDPDLDATKLEA